MKLDKLAGKVIVITGGSSGIGAQMALLAAKHGAVPIIMGRNEARLAEIAAKVLAVSAVGAAGADSEGASTVGDTETDGVPGATPTYFRLDVASAEQVKHTMEQVIALYGRIDVLINNAGYGNFNLFTDTSMQQVEDMMNVNYFGLVRCTQAVLPHMLAQRSGHIVNIASMAGKIGSPKSSAYAATKHAVLGLTNCLRQELFGTGIYVTAINPGPIETPFFDLADPSGDYVKNVKWFMLKPGVVARRTLNAVVNRRAEINMPFIAHAGVKLYQMFPRILDKLFYKIVNKK